MAVLTTLTSKVDAWSTFGLGWTKRPPYLLACAVTCALAAPTYAETVPSGQPVTLHEVLVDEVNNTPWLRFRFIAPQIARETGSIDYATAEPDMQHLCDTVALSYMRDLSLEGQMIVISLSDRETEFGTPDPAATQFFEAYRPVDNSCIWEGL